MNLRKYRYSVSDTYLDYEFDSEGPRGRIRKIVRYRPRDIDGITYVNLGFGDLDPKTGRIDDLVITNNQDRDLILATVAATVLEFTGRFPDATVFAMGSTPARTRLYQIGIAIHWNEIEPLLHISGYEQNEGWQPFRRGVNYKAFLITRK
ncbi:MAG TPA: hypothetical protein VHC96_23975 [Puia sp.]|jgi:hypothetical protein|nr:hypothetical protein [Puia sp.]